jgi:hypothetical protein
MTMPYIILIILIISMNIQAINLGIGSEPLRRYIPPTPPPTKVEKMPLYVSRVDAGDAYQCQLTMFNKIVPGKTYTVKIANVSCNNILATSAKILMTEHLQGKYVSINIYDRHNDTLIGDIEYNLPENGKKTTAAQALIQRGLSPYLRDHPSKALDLLETKAIDNRRGVWEKLDPLWIKLIQDELQKKNTKMLDSLLKEFPPELPKDTLHIISWLIPETYKEAPFALLLSKSTYTYPTGSREPSGSRLRLS